jgi:hypothetical protein
MSYAILKERMQRRPFEPFRVCLSTGERNDVRHREMPLLVHGGLYVAVPDASGEPPEVPAWCSLLHVAAVEPLPAGYAN